MKNNDEMRQNAAAKHDDQSHKSQTMKKNHAELNIFLIRNNGILKRENSITNSIDNTLNNI